MSRRLVGWALALGLVMTGSPTMAQPRAAGTLRASLGSEVDTNAERIPGGSRTDGLLRLVLDGSGRAELGKGWSLRGQLLAGAKRFFTEQEQDEWAQFLRMQITKAVGPLRIRPSGYYRISRVKSGLRDYSLGQGRLTLELVPNDAWTIAVWGAGGVYELERDDRFSYAGPQAGAYSLHRFGPRWLAIGWVEGEIRDYGGPILQLEDEVGLATVRFCGELDPSAMCQERQDNEVRFGARLQFQGVWYGALSYWFRLQRSNSADDLEDLDRHRVTLAVTAPLFWDLILSAKASLQINLGDSPTLDLALGDEDENRNNLQAQLRRRIVSDLYVEFRYALFAYQTQFGDDDVTDFIRHTFLLGLSLRTRAEGSLKAGPELGPPDLSGRARGP